MAQHKLLFTSGIVSGVRCGSTLKPFADRGTHPWDIFETLHVNHVSNSFYSVFRRESQVIQRKLLPPVYAKQVYLGFCCLHGQNVTDHSLL
jgi:hypothetical protein